MEKRQSTLVLFVMKDAILAQAPPTFIVLHARRTQRTQYFIWFTGQLCAMKPVLQVNIQTIRCTNVCYVIPIVKHVSKIQKNALPAT